MLCALHPAAMASTMFLYTCMQLFSEHPFDPERLAKELSFNSTTRPIHSWVQVPSPTARSRRAAPGPPPRPPPSCRRSRRPGQLATCRPTAGGCLPRTCLRKSLLLLSA